MISLSGCSDKESDPYDFLLDLQGSVRETREELKLQIPVMWTDFSNAYVYVYQFEPMAFGLSKEISVKRDGNDSELVSVVRFKYTMPVEEIMLQKKEIEAIICRIVEAADKCNNDQEKLDIIIDNLIKGFEYDDIEEDSNSVYFALCKKHANCQGVSKAFVLLCSKVGLQGGYCIGKLNGFPHMWNYVYVDGERIQLDLIEKNENIDMNNRSLEEMIEYR